MIAVIVFLAVDAVSHQATKKARKQAIKRASI